MNLLVAANKPRTPFARLLLNFLAAGLAAVVAAAGQGLAAGNNSVSLAWDPNAEPDVAGYRLQYGTVAGVYPNAVDAGSATSVTVSGLNQGTTYHFSVVAYNTAGQASPASDPVSYTVPGTPNTAPAATPFSVTVLEDGQSAATLSGTDAEGDLLVYSVVSAPTKGTLTGTPPNLTYRPAANATGSDSFTYRANDGALNSTPATVSVNITPVNDAPVAAARSATVAEDGQVAVVLSGSDVDGDSLTYTIVTGPTKGTLTGTPPNLTYLPAANVSGSDSFTYRVNDGSVNSANATVSLTITAVNDAPIANARTATTAEDTAVAIVLTGSDVEGSSLTYTIVSQPLKGTLSGTPPNVIYTPAANANGADSFTFRVRDGATNSAPATVSLTVTPVNDAPVANARTASTTSGTAVAIAVTGTDVEGSALTYAIVTPPAQGVLTGNGPNYTYTPNSSYVGSDSFSFRVNDGAANSAPAAVSITVNSNNRRPLAHGKTAAAMVNKTVAVTLSGFDGDGDALSYRLLTSPANGTITGSPPNLIYKPALRWTGEDTFTYVVNDGTIDSMAATVRVKVKARNFKPVATASAFQANQNSSTGFILAGTDADADPLTYAIAKMPRNGTITGTGPSFIYTPKPGFKGKDYFSFTAFDGVARSRPALVTVTVVNPNNRAPVAVAQNITTPLNKAVLVVLQATDADLDPVTYRIVTRPAVGRFRGKGANFSFLPPKGFTGAVSFTYAATDGVLESAPVTVSITVVAPPASTSRLAGRTKAAAGVGEIPPQLQISTDPARPGMLVLTVTGAPGETFTLEHSSDLQEWAAERQILVPATGGIEVEIAVPSGAGSGFFRLNTP